MVRPCPSSTTTNNLPPLLAKPVGVPPIDLLTPVLWHEIVAQPASIVGEAFPDKTEEYMSSLMIYSTTSVSNVQDSWCISVLPVVAFATLAFLDRRSGVVSGGVPGPTEETYRIVLDGLKGVGLEMKEV
ncbi:hypothetical protein OG21DRAFT_1526534 [Imleria badia]|nr:hypothetical protein OG21DRAFT_1526534 [Imleria badia]